ncbi:hypothetical protein HK101_010755 [Irineochytrium annulatum]|nr:hypothetical protein HK101_010755 [Irineochytrium annulatum]
MVEPPAPYTLLQYTSDGAFLTATTAFVRESADGNVNPPEYVPASNNPVARIAAARAAYAERRRRTMEDDRVEVVETGKFLGLPLKAWAVSLALLNFLYGLLITILTILALLPTFPAPTTSSLRPNSGSAIIAVLAVIFALFHLIGVVGIMTRGSRWLGLLRLWSEGGRRWVFLGVVFVVVSTVAIGWWVKVGGAVGVGAVMAGVQMLTAVLGQRYYDSCSKAREAASSIAMV